MQRVQAKKFSPTGRVPTRPVSVGLAAPRRAKRLSLFIVAGIGDYLAEAAVQIFTVPDDDDVPWDKIATPFTGRITRREERQLRRFYSVVQAVKGCTDPSATNYDPNANLDDGSCVFDPDADPEEGVVGYLQGAIKRVFNNNFTGDGNEPDWVITPFSGQIKSRREIDRMVSQGIGTERRSNPCL